MKTENWWGSRDGKLSKVPLVRYSTAYPTGRERAIVSDTIASSELSRRRAEFIDNHRALFWYTPEERKHAISDELLVETILNEGTDGR